MSHLTLFANPYDINATGFYFSNLNELHKKLLERPTVEEYELGYIDGDDVTLSLFKALKPSLADIELFFAAIETYATDIEKMALICYALENKISATLTDAIDFAESNTIFKGSVVEYAGEYVDSLIDESKVPELFTQYFDYESFARDLVLGGDVSEYSFANSSFVVLNS